MEIKQIGNIKAVLGDCLEYMQSIDNNTFDLCITSPPYNLGNKHHTGNKVFSPYPDNMNEADYQQQQINVLNELYRIIRPNGSLFYNHKNRIKDGFQISPYQWILETYWNIKQEIVWINRSQNFDKCRFYPMTERIYWLSKDKDTLFNNNIGLKDYNNWNPEGTNKIHKRAFPLDMVKSIFSCFPKKMKVIEPYGGSFTTAIVCHDLGFELTIIEKDENYFKESLKRLQWHQQQQTIQF